MQRPDPTARPRTPAAVAIAPRRALRLRHGLWLLLALALAAQADCPDSLPPEAGELKAYLRVLDRHAARCQQHAGYLALRGAVLLELGRVEAAVSELERALLLEPSHLGAQLDYARALAALGQVSAARELAAALAERADAPPAARAFLADFLTPPPAAWQREAAFELRAGYDDNLNRAPRLTSLTLTLPTGELTLPLDARERSQGGAFAEAQAKLQARRAQPTAAQELMLRLITRAGRNAHADLQQLDLLGLWRWGGELGDWGAQAAAGLTRWQGNTLRQYLRLGLLHAPAQANGDKPWFALALEARSHPQAPALDHRAAQAALTGHTRTGINWQLAAEREFDAARTGGEATRLVGRAFLRHALTPRWRLEAEAQLAHRREDGPYSPLIQGGARLTTTTAFVQLTAWRPLDRDWQAGLGLEYERQQSSLPLFDLERRAVFAGIRRRW